MNDLLKKYYAETDDKEKNAISDEINNYLSNFRENFDENTKDSGYAITLSDDIIEPSRVYWKTFAYLGLYTVLIFILYALLFHIKQIIGFIKGILGRNNYNRNSEPYIVKKDQLRPEPKTKEPEQIETKESEQTETKEKTLLNITFKLSK